MSDEWPVIMFEWEKPEDRQPKDVYCGQCGQMVKRDEAVVCPECLMVTCRECGGQVDRCWYCGEGWLQARGEEVKGR